MLLTLVMCMNNTNKHSNDKSKMRVLDGFIGIILTSVISLVLTGKAAVIKNQTSTR